MGIDTNAVIIVGLPDDELEINCDDFGGDWDKEGILEAVSPYFDSTEYIVGVIVAKSPDYWYNEIELKEIMWEVAAAKNAYSLHWGKA